jgi:hypothetical protein
MFLQLGGIKKGVQKMTNHNQEFDKAFSKIVFYAWVIIIIITSIVTIASLIFYFGGWYKFPDYWYSWPLSYFLGAMVNLFTFNLLKKNIALISGDSKGISRAVSNYIIRFFIYGFVLFIAFKNEKLNPFFVLGGYFTVRIAMYIYSYLKKD